MSLVKLKFTFVRVSFRRNHPVFPRVYFSSFWHVESFVILTTFIPSAISQRTPTPYSEILVFFESSPMEIPASPASSIRFSIPSSMSALIAWKVSGEKAIFWASNLASMARILSSLYLSKEYLDLSISVSCYGSFNEYRRI